MAGTIRAAGVVMVRRNRSGIQVLLVHRPRQDDWSLPKGKADPGEMMPDTARRETLEETGLDVTLGAPLIQQRYRVNGQPKTVDYWVGHIRPGGPGFAPNREVDRIEWMSVSRARAKLTYPRDRDLVIAAVATPRTSPLVILRHSEAMRRADFKGSNDAKRPLTNRGRAHARTLVEPLTAFGVTRVHSSDSRRCMQTVEPLAKALRADVVEEPLFSEEVFDRRPKTAMRRMRWLALRPAGAVLCSHRPVLPDIMACVAAEFELKPKLPALRPSLDPGGFVVVHRELSSRGKLTGRVVSVERFDA